MNKKMVGIIGLVFILIGTALMQPVIAETQQREFEAALSVIGFIRIDTEKYEIKGFVLVGTNEGEFLLFKTISVFYDGTSVFVTKPMPLVFNIKYNPA